MFTLPCAGGFAGSDRRELLALRLRLLTDFGFAVIFKDGDEVADARPLGASRRGAKSSPNTTRDESVGDPATKATKRFLSTSSKCGDTYLPDRPPSL